MLLGGIPLKVSTNSLDEILVIKHMLHDAQQRFGAFYNARACRLTCQKLEKRARSEGLGFLTKTLPRLGKHFDQALTGQVRLNARSVGFAAMDSSELPRFLGEFFIRIFSEDGHVLPDPDAQCVKLVREILNAFYKYELPYNEVQEQAVISSFEKTEDDLNLVGPRLALLRTGLQGATNTRRSPVTQADLADPARLAEDSLMLKVAREARIYLNDLFAFFDPYDITPRHGPGVVATKQRHSEKYLWTNVCSRITDVYPFDAYFCASPGHVCDVYDSFDTVTDKDLPANVLLVPKDSRGPRLISCEPVDFQWIQQGLRQAIYLLVERHALTRHNVFFTDQGPNQRGALLGSLHGNYATLDLKEASDRVSLDLVRLLFPEHLLRFLEASRSTSTVLPSGKILPLQKFAPMGSALCFPIMALSIWSILTACAPDADTRESILVYGDDVIVPTTFVASAMSILEAFGLQINRAKSCTQGLFRESCGMDAFQGVDVTPVRFRTVWDESPRPDVYTSWISYANSLYDRQYYAAYEYIVGNLARVYGPIPGEDMNLSCPSLRVSPAPQDSFRRRTNSNLQKLEYRVRVVESPSVTQEVYGWSMLLRYFTENQRPSRPPEDFRKETWPFRPTDRDLNPDRSFAVSQYTKRHSSLLKWRWR